MRLGMMKGTRRRLAERLDHEAGGLLQRDAELILADRLHLLDEGHEGAAHGVALAPAFERGDDVLARHRRAVVELEPGAQLEVVNLLVRRHLPRVDHLRLDPALLVGAEQRVVDHVAVVAAHVGGRPDRVEDRQVGVRHDGQYVLVALRAGGARESGDGRRDDAGKNPLGEHGCPSVW
jgi:hypothetical protein